MSRQQSGAINGRSAAGEPPAAAVRPVGGVDRCAARWPRGVRRRRRRCGRLHVGTRDHRRWRRPPSRRPCLPRSRPPDDTTGDRANGRPRRTAPPTGRRPRARSPTTRVRTARAPRPPRRPTAVAAVAASESSDAEDATETTADGETEADGRRRRPDDDRSGVRVRGEHDAARSSAATWARPSRCVQSVLQAQRLRRRHRRQVRRPDALRRAGVPGGRGSRRSTASSACETWTALDVDEQFGTDTNGDGVIDPDEIDLTE